MWDLILFSQLVNPACMGLGSSYCNCSSGSLPASTEESSMDQDAWCLSHPWGFHFGGSMVGQPLIFLGSKVVMGSGRWLTPCQEIVEATMGSWMFLL